MKSTVLTFSILGLLFLIGCGGGDDVTSPTSGPEPLVSETVGTGGGELVDDQIVLTIPAGALSADTKLSIYDDAALHPYAQTGAPLVRVEGLPEDLGVPLVLRMRSSGEKSDDTVLFLGEERDSYDAERGVTWFELACRDSAGWSIAQIDRGPYVLDADKDATPAFKVAAVTGLDSSLTSAGHFQLRYDPTIVTGAQVAMVSGYLELAYSQALALGFDFGGEAMQWPRPFYFRDLDTVDRFAQYTTAPFGRGHFTLDPDVLVNSVAVGVVVGHEVLHCAQDLYDTRPPAEWKTINYQRLWLDEATASWFEEKFYPGDDFYPVSLNDIHYVTALNGFAGRRGYTLADMGYGLSTLVKYVVEAQGEGRIHQAYEVFPDSGFATASFLHVLDPPMSEWVLDFQHQLITNQIYDYIEGGSLWNDQEPSDGLVGDTTPAFQGVWKLWQMGSDPTFFTISDPRTEPATALRIRSGTSEPVIVSLYGLQAGQDPTLLGSAADSLVVNGLPSLMSDYDKFMALGTRIAYPTSTYSGPLFPYPVFELSEEEDLARFETGTIRLRYRAFWSDGGDIAWQGLVFANDEGTVANHTYHAEWDSVNSDNGVRDQGHITLEFSPSTMDLVSWSATSRTDYTDPGTYSTYQASGTGLPLDYSSDTTFRYQADESAVCAAVSSIQIATYTDGVLDRQLTTFGCNDDSFIRIYLTDTD